MRSGDLFVPPGGRHAYGSPLSSSESWPRGRNGARNKLSPSKGEEGGLVTTRDCSRQSKRTWKAVQFYRLLMFYYAIIGFVFNTCF